MKNSALIWTFIVGIVIAVLFAFNYQGNKNTIPLSEIFPEEATMPMDVEYEFVDKDEGASQTSEQPKAAQTVASQTPTQKAPEEVAQAQEKAIEVPATVKEDLAKTSPQNVPFTIQVASFKSKSAAEESLNKVTEKGYKGYIVSKDLGEKGTWHRVYVGVYESMPQAQSELSKVRQDYPNSFVIAPK